MILPQASQSIGNQLGKLIGTIQKVAPAFGIKLPLDSEINSLMAKAKQVNANNYAMNSFIAKTVVRLDEVAKTDPAAGADATSIRNAINQARSLGAIAAGRIADAITQGTVARESFRYGSKAAAPTATFFSKKALADAAYGAANNAFNLVRSTIEDRNRRLMAGTSLTPKSVGKVAADTLWDFGSWTAKTAEKVGQGTMAAGNYAQYLMPAAIAFGGLILLSNLTALIPRRRD